MVQDVKQRASSDQTVFNQEDADAKRKQVALDKIAEIRRTLTETRKP